MNNERIGVGWKLGVEGTQGSNTVGWAATRGRGDKISSSCLSSWPWRRNKAVKRQPTAAFPIGHFDFVGDTTAGNLLLLANFSGFKSHTFRYYITLLPSNECIGNRWGRIRTNGCICPCRHTLLHLNYWKILIIPRVCCSYILRYSTKIALFLFIR